MRSVKAIVAAFIALSTITTASAADKFVATPIVISSAGFQSAFTWNLAAGTYKFRALIFLKPATSPADFAFKFSGSAAATISAYSPIAGTVSKMRAETALSGFSEPIISVPIEGTITSATSGTFSVEFSKRNAASLTIARGSVMTLEKL